MGIDWELYTKRLNINGSTKRERDLNKLQNDITTKSVDSLSYKTVYINNIERYLMINKDTKTSTKTFETLPNETVILGELVVWDSINYLITEIDLDDEVYIKGNLTLCNYILKFQNTLNDIVSYPCVVLNASQYNSGIDENKTLTIGSNQFMIYLPLNAETSQLTYDRRLFISNNTAKPVPYKVTRPDDVSKTNNGVGVLCLIMSQDQLNTETDRPDLGICDYHEKIIPVGDIPIKYIGKPELKIGSIYKTFTADIADTVTWTVTSLTTNLETQINGNIIKIKCPFDESYIGMSVTLKAETVDDYGEIILKVKGVV